tara:strand:+ start:437 stop:631 length:195 start_codon:yes stop_codon:yes gene_type:complete
MGIRLPINNEATMTPKDQRIIAAAPELLEALKLLFKAWDWKWIDPCERAEIYRQVESAIRKAEG